MSQEQIVHFRLFKALLIQLKNFGLNPTDWRIDRKSSLSQNEILLVNRGDRDFKFVGSLGVKNGFPAWKNLTLISL